MRFLHPRLGNKFLKYEADSKFPQVIPRTQLGVADWVIYFTNNQLNVNHESELKIGAGGNGAFSLREKDAE